MEDSLVEHLYDDMFIELDVLKTARFFAWLGVVKPTAVDQLVRAGPMIALFLT